MKKITNVRMIIREIFIKKNKDLVGKSEVFALAVVADDLPSNPSATETDIFENVKKKTSLTLGGSGLVIYRSGAAGVPKTLDYIIVVMESDQRVRTAGETIGTITASDEFKKIKGAALKAAIAQPQLAIAAVAADSAFKLITKAFKMNKDDQMLLIQGSYDKAFDRLGANHGVVTQENQFVRLKFEVQVVEEEVV